MLRGGDWNPRLRPKVLGDHSGITTEDEMSEHNHEQGERFYPHDFPNCPACREAVEAFERIEAAVVNGAKTPKREAEA
jgi:hypothetical protein